MKRLLFFCALLIIFTLKSSYSEANEDLEELTFNSLLNAIDDFDSDQVADILLKKNCLDNHWLNRALLYASGNRHTDNINAMQQILAELLLAGADSNYQDEETLDSVLISLVKNPYTKPILINTIRGYGNPFLTLQNIQRKNAAQIAKQLYREDLLDCLVA